MTPEETKVFVSQLVQDWLEKKADPAEAIVRCINLNVEAAVAEEREACAKLAAHFGGSLWPESYHEAADVIAAAIRARDATT